MLQIKIISSIIKKISNMKKINYLTIILLLLLCVTIFGSCKASSKEIELVVFASSSMKETLEQIKPLYKETAPNVKLTFNFDSTGTLLIQIQTGAECDVFISAAQKQMDNLDITADRRDNINGQDFVLQGTRIDFLENRVTLCVPEGNPAGIINFSDWADKLSNDDILFAMGNDDVALGQYTQNIFTFFKLNEYALANDGKIKYGSNVQEVSTLIKEAGVSSGVIYRTDAYSAGLEIVDYAVPEMCGDVVYPAAVMKASKNPDAAKAFLDYLGSSEAMAVFEKAGFTAPGSNT